MCFFTVRNKKKNWYDENREKIIADNKKKREEHQNKPQYQVDQKVREVIEENDEAIRNRYKDPEGWARHRKRADDN